MAETIPIATDRATWPVANVQQHGDRANIQLGKLQQM